MRTNRGGLQGGERNALLPSLRDMLDFSVGPEAFDVVKAALLFQEYVDHDIDIVHQHPLACLATFDIEGLVFVGDPQSFPNCIAQSLNVLVGSS